MRDPRVAAPPPTPQLAPLAGTALIVFMILIGGFTPVAAKDALAKLPPISTGAIRFAIAGGLLLLVHLIRIARGSANRNPLERRDVWRVAVASVLCVPVNQVCFLTGVHLANASHAGLFYALNPVLVYLFTRLAGTAAGNRTMAIAASLAFSGAAVIGLGSLSVKCDARMFFGDLLLLGAVTSWSLYVVISQPLGPKYGAVRTLTWSIVLGAILYLPAIFVDGADFNLFTAGTRAVVGFVFITVGTSFLAYMIWFFAMARMDINRLAIAGNAAPIVAVLAAHFYRGEPITLFLFTGGALILYAIFLANWSKLKQLRRKSRT